MIARAALTNLTLSPPVLALLGPISRRPVRLTHGWACSAVKGRVACQRPYLSQRALARGLGSWSRTVPGYGASQLALADRARGPVPVLQLKGVALPVLPCRQIAADFADFLQ